MASVRPLPTLVDLFDPAAWQARRPLLIAHRGGVVGPGAPENSLAAIRAAAVRGYDLVEVDVRSTRDGRPVLFHGDWSRTLRVSCGVDRAIEQLTWDELRVVRHRASDQGIPGLSEALALCAELRLGVMLDIKVAGMPALVRRVAEVLDAHGLARAGMTISTDPAVRDGLAARVMLRASPAEIVAALEDGGRLDGRFWFGHADELPSADVARLRAAGGRVVPSINRFHYPPHAHRELAGEDVARLSEAGVDGFQIDDDYRDLFSR